MKNKIETLQSDLKISDEIKEKNISKYEDKQLNIKKSKSLKNNIFEIQIPKNSKNKIINKFNFKKLSFLNKRKSDILSMKKIDFFKFYNDYFNNNENTIKN